MRTDLRLTDPEINRLRLLKAIRRAEPVARTQLSALTGLSGAAITELTADFLRQDILVEERAALVGKGRPRQQLRLNPDGRRVIGASIFEDSTMSVTFANVRGDTVFARRVPLKRTEDVEAIGVQVAGVIDQVIRESPVRRADIECIGVGLPAAVDSTRGVVEWLQTYPPRPVPLAEIIQSKLGLPVLLDSTFNAVARAEHWFGEGQVDDFCIVGLGLGIGFARYAAGALRVGAHGMNAEFGHMKLVLDGRLCWCGERGCLAAYSTTYAIMRQVRELRGAPALPLFDQLSEPLSRFVANVMAGDEQARAVFQFAGRCLGVALANHVNVSDPGRIIVLLGDPSLELIAPDVDAAFETNTVPGLRGKAKLEFRPFDEDVYARGSAALALERLGRTSSELNAA